MHIVVLILASLLITGWLLLLFRTTREDIISLLSVRAFDNREEIIKLHEKDKRNNERLRRYKNLPPIILKVTALFIVGSSYKKIKKLELESKALKSGTFKSLYMFIIPGYVLQSEFSAIGKGTIHKLILSKCIELYGRKFATEKSKQLLAKLLSYPVLGLSCIFAVGAVFMGSADMSTGLTFIGLGALIILVLVYALYDHLNDSVIKRRFAISKQFPNVVSTLALLVTSGMIMDRAWKQTAYSGESELYKEMRMTSDELDNLVSPEAAYSNFINRCNTKETAKLASAIMQNLSKGNAEIGRLLKDMAHEAWQERRHTAKREAEKANSKLMIPTMLLFLTILIMLMVPIAMNFSGI